MQIKCSHKEKINAFIDIKSLSQTKINYYLQVKKERKKPLGYAW